MKIIIVNFEEAADKLLQIVSFWEDAEIIKQAKILKMMCVKIAFPRMSSNLNNRRKAKEKTLAKVLS